jgi:hypothetical protein
VTFVVKALSSERAGTKNVILASVTSTSCALVKILIEQKKIIERRVLFILIGNKKSCHENNFLSK